MTINRKWSHCSSGNNYRKYFIVSKNFHKSIRQVKIAIPWIYFMSIIIYYVEKNFVSVRKQFKKYKLLNPILVLSLNHLITILTYIIIIMIYLPTYIGPNFQCPVNWRQSATEMWSTVIQLTSWRYCEMTTWWIAKYYIYTTLRKCVSTYNVFGGVNRVWIFN